MSEGEIMIVNAIDKNTKAVSELAISIKALVIHYNLQREEALQPHKEYNTRVEETVEVVEEMIQDFKGVTVMLETDKAYLVVKNGHQKWVAKSHLTLDYDLGSNVDLELTNSALK